ncbi:MAG: hypothetical protein AB8U69_02420 [Anaplasma ovis]|uniref:hypothetical protein n=1 Tax=Anaplasma ovis TaxID=142058 RepID=UPI001313F102|nr:hypothetical protein [Anaplasma ovis]
MHNSMVYFPSFCEALCDKFRCDENLRDGACAHDRFRGCPISGITRTSYISG